MRQRQHGEYLYGNLASVAPDRLRGLESIEDASTIERLSALGVATGWHCLEIGGGAGSIARWLSERVGVSGRTVATDIEPGLLDPTRYEVWRHDLRSDPLPPAAFDLIHARHVLIHLEQAKHPEVLQSFRAALRAGGTVLIEESDLRTWRPCTGTPERLVETFTAGVAATLDIYRSRAMNVALGCDLSTLLRAAGFAAIESLQRTRQVQGGSDEAAFHQRTARQLAESQARMDSGDAETLERFDRCLDDPDLRYETRATVSVSALNA